jgi:hypothetical protein
MTFLGSSSVEDASAVPRALPQNLSLGAAEQQTADFILPCPVGSCIKFRVHDVAPSTKLLPKLAGTTWWTSKDPCWSCSDVATDIPAVRSGIDSPSLLAVSVYEAFYKHFPVKLNPNAVWLTIAQGFACFVGLFSEELRHKFVSHEGKELITISDPNPPEKVNWPACFTGFSEQVKTRVGAPTVTLLQASFSNSTPVDILASHVTLMDTFKSYFNYEIMCGCGLPSIELLGSVADWEEIRAKAQGLRAYELTKGELKGKEPLSKNLFRENPRRRPEFLKIWLDELIPVLEHFVEAARGRPDRVFFGSCVNLSGVSGMPGPPITGWISVFYPYLKEGLVENDAMGRWRAAYDVAKAQPGVQGITAQLNQDEGFRSFKKRSDAKVKTVWGGVQLSEIPIGFATAPVTLMDIRTQEKIEVKVLGGLATMHQALDGALEVRSGWAVRPSERRITRTVINPDEEEEEEEEEEAKEEEEEE